MESIGAIAVLSLVLVLITLAYSAGRSSMRRFRGDAQEDPPDQSLAKEENKQTVLSLLSQHGELSNAELRKRLGVSARTIVNYMDELEQEGRVRQAGKIGRSVTYRLN